MKAGSNNQFVTKEGRVLKATNTLPADTEFNNTFTPAAAQAQFKFTKRLEGKELTKDAFTFELLENGNVIQNQEKMQQMDLSHLMRLNTTL